MAPGGTLPVVAASCPGAIGTAKAPGAPPATQTPIGSAKYAKRRMDTIAFSPFSRGDLPDKHAIQRCFFFQPYLENPRFETEWSEKFSFLSFFREPPRWLF
jgi:hypothetical protein